MDQELVKWMDRGHWQLRVLMMMMGKSKSIDYGGRLWR